MEDKHKARAIKKDAQSGATVEDEGDSKKTWQLSAGATLFCWLRTKLGWTTHLSWYQFISTGEFLCYPRIDYALLEKYNEGIIASSACFGGVYAGNYWENREDDEVVLDAMRESTQRMVDIFGDRWYAEIQWNNIKEQHELNQYEFKLPKSLALDWSRQP